MGVKLLQQNSNQGCLASAWMDDRELRSWFRIAEDTSLPFICNDVATMPADHSGRFGTQSPNLDSLNAKVTFTRSAFGGTQIGT